MGRPGLKIGTYGKLWFTELRDSGFEARCRYNQDGKTRQLRAVGATEQSAEQHLVDQLIERGLTPAPNRWR